MTKAHNDEMNLAWQFIEGTDVSVFLTGKAGTGKTTFLRRIRTLSPKRMVVVAPTGVAAINAQGVTIHSFFQLSPSIHLPNATKTYKERGNHFQMSKEKKNIMRTMDLLVIDEISMVRADTLDAIDSVLRKYRDRYRPFGGVQLLLIGDLQQLAPVAVEKEWDVLKDYYETPYFFSSHALQQIQYVTIELQHIYRQEDARFISLLAHIRNGQLDAATVDALNARHIPNYEPDDSEECIRLTTHNYMAQRVNESKLNGLPAAPHRYEAIVSGDFPETSYPADAALTLKVGAQVMFIRNATDQAYYNGKMGRVVGFADTAVLVQCKDDAQPISVSPAEWQNTRMRINDETKEIEEEIIGTFRQIPLRLAWAITIHKSQGLTFDRAILDVNNAFAHGQVYVALSRCRSLEGMVLARPIDLRSLASDQSVNDYIARELASSANAKDQLDTFRQQFFRHLLEECFSFAALHRSLHYVVRIFEEHLAKQQPELTAAWKDAAQQFDADIYQVSLKFHAQLNTLLQTNADTLHERIGKGAGYFATQLHRFDVLNARTQPEIGNKVVKKQFTGALDTFRLDFRSKTATLECVAEHGFSTKTYLKDKANALLQDTADTATTRRKRTAKKEPKEKTQNISLRLYQSGKSVDEIATDRNLTPTTIFTHLAGFIPTGEVELHDLIPDAHITLVREALAQHGNLASLYAFYQSHPTLSQHLLFPAFRLILQHLRKNEAEDK